MLKLMISLKIGFKYTLLSELGIQNIVKEVKGEI